MKNSDIIIEELKAFIKKQWDIETSIASGHSAASFGDTHAARELIEQYLEYCNSGNIALHGGQQVLECHHQIKKMLQRILDVDMTKPTNRKGGIPQAVGLVSKKGTLNIVRDRVLAKSIHNLYNDGTNNINIEKCYSYVARAYNEVQNQKISEENVKKIYQRLNKGLF